MRTRNRLDVGFALVALTCGGRYVQSAEPTGCLRYEPQPVELRGKLITVRKYGPPNFGESPQTDMKIDVPILVLSHAIDTCGDSTSLTNRSSFRGVTEMQVVFHGSVDAPSFIGQDVVVTGTLFERYTMNHYTSVLLSLKEIRPAKGRT